MDTAYAIAEECARTVIEAPGLIDLDFGEWEGLTWDEAAKAAPGTMEAFRSEVWSATPPGGEPVASLDQRINVTLASLADPGQDGAVVAVTHDLPIRLALCGILGLSGPDLWRLDVTPGSVIRLAVTTAGFEVPDTPRLIQS